MSNHPIVKHYVNYNGELWQVVAPSNYWSVVDLMVKKGVFDGVEGFCYITHHSYPMFWQLADKRIALEDYAVFVGNALTCDEGTVSYEWGEFCLRQVEQGYNLRPYDIVRLRREREAERVAFEGHWGL